MNPFLSALRDRLVNLSEARREVLARILTLEIAQKEHKTLERALKIKRYAKAVNRLNRDLDSSKRIYRHLSETHND